MIRSYGQGSIFERADGRWVAQWDLARTDGRRKRRQLLALTEHEARVRMTSDPTYSAMRGPTDRFWGMATVMPTGCWEWTGSRLPKGYGLVRWDGRTMQAHRVAWELTNGSIPDGLWVLHHCDNPPCICPAHLWLGTAAENAADMLAKGRQRK